MQLNFPKKGIYRNNGELNVISNFRWTIEVKNFTNAKEHFYVSLSAIDKATVILELEKTENIAYE